MSFFFWLDILSTISLIFDIGWISDGLFEAGDAGNASKIARAGRASRIGTRAGRIVRIVRLIRLVKLYKHAQQAILEREALNKEKEAREVEDDSRKANTSDHKNINIKESHSSPSKLDRLESKFESKHDIDKSEQRHESNNKMSEILIPPEKKQIKRRNSSLLSNLEKARVEMKDKNENETAKLKLNLIKEEESESFPDPERMVVGDSTSKNNILLMSLNGNISEKIDPPAYPNTNSRHDGQVLDLTKPNRSFGDPNKRSISSPSHQIQKSRGKYDSEGEVHLKIK
jgi:hypothetical protein